MAAIAAVPGAGFETRLRRICLQAALVAAIHPMNGAVHARDGSRRVRRRGATVRRIQRWLAANAAAARLSPNRACRYLPSGGRRAVHTCDGGWARSTAWGDCAEDSTMVSCKRGCGEIVSEPRFLRSSIRRTTRLSYIRSLSSPGTESCGYSTYSIGKPIPSFPRAGETDGGRISA